MSVVTVITVQTVFIEVTVVTIVAEVTLVVLVTVWTVVTNKSETTKIVIFYHFFLRALPSCSAQQTTEVLNK